MEHRFHPLVYKTKGNGKNFSKKEEYIEKKLTNPKETAQRKEKESNI
jgi:hypothetical protein